VRKLQPTISKLAATQLEFLRAADAISAANWQQPPSTGGWSAAELVAHLCQVERGILVYADRVIRRVPQPVPFYRRLHFPMAFVKVRLIRRRAPTAPNPAALAGKDSMLAELRAVRERTLAFLEETGQRDLRTYFWPHPFLGQLSFYDWFAFVAAHQVRHIGQMLEIAKNLPKDVANSQK
jgi:uncharacterized damage-inducible protein DinB